MSALTFPVRMPLPLDSDDDDSEGAAGQQERALASEAQRSKLHKGLTWVQLQLIRLTDRVFFPSRRWWWRPWGMACLAQCVSVCG
jgi:hypothetical protein